MGLATVVVMLVTLCVAVFGFTLVKILHKTDEM